MSIPQGKQFPKLSISSSLQSSQTHHSHRHNRHTLGSPQQPRHHFKHTHTPNGHHMCTNMCLCVCLYAARGNKHTKNVVFRLEQTTTKLTSAVDRINETYVWGTLLGDLSYHGILLAARNSEILKSRKSHEYKKNAPWTTFQN